MSPRTRSDTMAFSLRAQADVARAKGKDELAYKLDRMAESFDISRATLVPGTVPCIRREAP